MTTQLPFDGGASPVPPDEPAIGHWVYVKDDDNVGDDAGEIYSIKGEGQQTRYLVVFYSSPKHVYHISRYLREEMEFAGLSRPEGLRYRRPR